MSPTDPELMFPAWQQRCQDDAAALVDQVLPATNTAGIDTPAELRPAWRQSLRALLSQPGARPAPDDLPSPLAAPTAGMTGALAGLSLMSDDEVNEHIATRRMVQAMEGAAEWPLRDLFNRCLVWRWHAEHLGYCSPVLLEPPVLAQSLCAALAECEARPTRRLAMLNQLTPPLVAQSKALYERQAEQLEQWGVQAQRLTIRRTPSATPALATSTSTDPGPSTSTQPAAPLGVSAPQIPALLARLAEEANLSGGMTRVLQRLAAPVQRSVAENPQLLASGDNTLWRLVDRLACLAELDDASRTAGQPALHERLGPMVDALATAPMALSLAHYEKALNHLERLALAALPPTAPNTQPSEDQLLTEERGQELMPMIHHQMVDRLRGAAVLAGVRQFLLGPWVQVLAQASAAGGVESPEVVRWTALIDALAEAGARDRARPPTPAEIDCLVLDASDGMRAISVPAARVAQHQADLRAELATWPRAASTEPQSLQALLDEGDEEHHAQPPHAGSQDMAASDWVHHADLATVPIAMDDSGSGQAASQAWLDSLSEGDLCRIFLRGRWTSVRLDWLSDRKLYFAFSSHQGTPFCTSRRVLERMRTEGLVTTIHPGQWLREAANTLPADLS
jgi:hypothetical protein